MNRSTINHDTPAPAPDSWPQGRTELIAVLVLCLIAAGLRVAFPSRMAVEHFDEGVYASNLWCPDDGYRYPARHLYAPSLMPAMIEWSMIAFGTANWVPMLPSLVFGTLTIPLLWWVGRQWFGPLAGIAAATLLSLSDFHIAFSRSALTDVPLCFWLLLAIYLFERAFRDFSWLTAIAAGVVTGLAWWIKYNGWLPLAISLSGLIAWSLVTPRAERELIKRLMLWGIAAATALLVWSPYWWSLPDGYGEVAANHRGYLVGIAGWLESSERHWRSLKLLDGRLTVVGFGLFMVMTAFAASESIPNTTSNAPIDARIRGFLSLVLSRQGLGIGIFAAVFFAVIAVFAGLVLSRGFGTVLAFPAFALFSLFIIVRAISERLGLRRRSESGDRLAIISQKGVALDLSIWILLAWWAGLTLTIPVYRPYPRLALPWFISGCLMAAVAGRWMGMEKNTPKEVTGAACSPRSAPSRGPNRLWSAWFAAIAGLLIWLGIAWVEMWVWRGLSCPGWQSRTALSEIATRVQEATRQEVTTAHHHDIGGKQAVLYVFAEPGLFFHLPADDLAIGPVRNLGFLAPDAQPLGLPKFLVTGPHADRMTDFHDEFQKYADRLELVQSWPYAASDVVLLDQVPPAELAAERAKLEVRLFRVK